MRLLVVTNLYPPQELGGYGRSIADFVWGLQERGHQVQVLSSDAPYLGPSSDGPSGEPVDRGIQLKGNYRQGVQKLQDPAACRTVDQANAALVERWLQNHSWDGVLLGNLDFLGVELLQALLKPGIPVLHHVGFVHPPFAPAFWPTEPHYQLVSASRAVRQCLVSAGLPVANAPVVYPGARVELFGEEATGRPLPEMPNGTAARPLRVGFAGLLMPSKGAHTVVEAISILRERGVIAVAMLAGGRFKEDYIKQMEGFIRQQGLEDQVQFVKQLSREQLARFYRLQHVGVFPSIQPEAFGIVAAEMMASGLALASSGVGGAAELFEDGVSGLGFEAGNPASLAGQLEGVLHEPGRMRQIQQSGESDVRQRFSVRASAHHLEQIWKNATEPTRAADELN